jgi:hypothetical protein
MGLKKPAELRGDLVAIEPLALARVEGTWSPPTREVFAWLPGTRLELVTPPYHSLSRADNPVAGKLVTAGFFLPHRDECPSSKLLPDMPQNVAIDLAFCHSWNPSGRTPSTQRRLSGCRGSCAYLRFRMLSTKVLASPPKVAPPAAAIGTCSLMQSDDVRGSLPQVAAATKAAMISPTAIPPMCRS